MRVYWPTYRLTLPEKDLIRLDVASLVQKANSTLKECGAAMIILSELCWLRCERLIYFIEPGLEVFLEKLAAKVSLTDLDLPEYETIVLSFHPSTKIPAILVTNLRDMIVFHIWDEKKDGHTTAFMSKTSNKGEAIGDLPPNSQQIMNLVFGLYIYRAAHEDMIKDGFPDDMKERCQRHMQISGEKPIRIMSLDVIQIGRASCRERV